MPTVVLPGGGRLAIYPTVKTRWGGPGLGVGAGVSDIDVCPPYPSCRLMNTGYGHASSSW
jgi:hypothetical protein